VSVVDRLGLERGAPARGVSRGGAQQRFEPRRRAGAEPECAGCEIVSVCGGCCLDWARKDPLGNGFFSPTECAYRRGLVKAAKRFLASVEDRPQVMGAIRKHLDLCNQDWRHKTKEK